MVSKELLDILVCPETKQDVAVADAALVEKLNQAIAVGKLVNQGGARVEEKIDGGLVRKDGKVLYPVRSDIPIMLIEEAIPLDQH